MSTGEDVIARVEAFIADFHAAWRRAGSVPVPALDPFTAEPGTSFDPVAWADQPHDFVAWERELGTLVDTHFTTGARTGEEGCLSGRPPHDPATERVVGVEVRRTRAEVRTLLAVTGRGGYETHYVYRMVAAEGRWRISRIVHTSAPPGDRLVGAAEVHRLLAAMSAERGDPVPAHHGGWLAGLFSEAHEVTELGTLETSGVLAVHDFGWVRHDLAPLDRRVPAGAHRVEVARDRLGTNLALRLCFSEEPVVDRVSATRVGYDHLVGVDAGNVAILDFLSLAACSQLHAEESYQAQAVDGGGADAAFSLTGRRPDAVLVTSGHGDGAYPAYWGLSAAGAPAELVVDFLVAGDQGATP